MSIKALGTIAKILEAKSHDPVPMNRGMLVGDIAKLTGIPQQTINSAFSNEMECASFGIFKLTPQRQRYVLWAFSQEVADKANAGPFDSSAGIDPKVQAAEVAKIITPCENPDDHYNWKQVFDALTEASERTNTPRVNIMKDVMTYIKEYVP